MKTIEIISGEGKDYISTKCDPYVEINGEMKIIQSHLDCSVPLLINGPKGTGKTLSIAKFAHENKIPLLQFDCSESTKRNDLIGRFVLIGDEIKYQLGILPMAIDIANKNKKCILVLEELTALSPNVQKILNQILDWRKHVFIPEIGKTFRLENGNQLLIGATTNPSGYGGIFEMNEDLRSRFASIFREYPNEKKENDILNSYEENEEEIKTKLITLAKETRHGAQGELSYCLSTRDLVLFLQTYASYKKILGAKALYYTLETVILNKYEDSEERQVIKDRVRSVFGLDVV